jgi:hypothetical protein
MSRKSRNAIAEQCLVRTPEDALNRLTLAFAAIEDLGTPDVVLDWARANALVGKVWLECWRASQPKQS